MASGDVHLRRIHDVAGRITAAGLAASNATLVPPPAVAVGLAGQGKTRGTVALTLCELSTNQSIALLRGDDIRLQTAYLFHNLDRRYEELRARSSGGGRGGLSKGILNAVPLELPPLPEQHVITEILDTLDTTIRQTEAIMEKLKQVKQGLLHDLLTRGIDVNGELRPPQSQAPHLYKDSPLGWIPREWDALRLVAVLSGIEAGKSPACQDTPASGDAWGVLKVGAVHPAGLRSTENKIVEDRHLWKAEYLVHKGDLLLSRANTAELVGLVCLVDFEPVKLMLSDKTLRLNLRADRMLSSFAVLALQSAATRAQIENAATGTSGSMKNISQAAIESLMVPAPGVNEQIRLAARVAAIGARTDSETASLLKLTTLKSGLMDDLLTGRIRVTPLLA
jgi:type I restriction enzyme S subunit